MRGDRPGQTHMARAPAALDEALLSGIPEKELTPSVRVALMSLMDEVTTLRAELSAAKSHIAEIVKLADRDPLLDILNRRAFAQELNRMLAMIDRYQVTASLVFIDLNDLKKVNDDKGHVAGDAALKHVASVLSSNIRQTDGVGRLGGDEFGLLLAQTDQAMAEQKLRDLSRAVAQTPVSWKGDPFSVSISSGVIELTRGVSAQDALERADTAMYKAKKRR